jgi:hypothetical protein
MIILEEKQQQQEKDSERNRRAKYAKKQTELIMDQQKTFKEKNPESESERKRKSRNEKKITEINRDTDKELVCAICLERILISQCSPANSLKDVKYNKYVTENKLTLGINGKYIICTCRKTQISKNSEPKRDFWVPQFSCRLHTKNIEAKNDQEKKFLNLNKCEDYLLKLVGMKE